MKIKMLFDDKSSIFISLNVVEHIKSYLFQMTAYNRKECI